MAKDRTAEDHIAVRSLGLRFSTGHQVEAHAHPWHQLVYATHGAMTVETPYGAWVVPPHRAVWVPAGFAHSIRMTGAVRMRTVYFRPDVVVGVPDDCAVVHVTPLLRELILEVLRLRMLYDDVPEHERLTGLIVDRLEQGDEAPLKVRLPSDARARRVAENARADLTSMRSVADLAIGSGASARTIERVFRCETGLTFGQWLQQVRALHAIERLAAGDTVTQAALSVGYESTSAFIAMFKRVMGSTPGRYFQGQPPRSTLRTGTVE